MTPHLAQQLVPRRHGAAPVVQREQEIVLERREAHRLAFLQHEAAGALDRDLAESLGDVIEVGAPRAPQQGLDSRDELEHAERLGDVVVGTMAEPHHLVRLLAARREDLHRRLVPVGAQRAQHTIAVHPRQHQVEQDEIGIPPPRTLEPHQAVLRDVHLVALDLEVVAEPEGQVGIVFDDEQLGRHALLSEAPTVSRSGSTRSAGRSARSGASAADRGSSTKKREPRCSRPGRGSTPVRPP